MLRAATPDTAQPQRFERPDDPMRQRRIESSFLAVQTRAVRQLKARV